jgi:hypothetical protein
LEKLKVLELQEHRLVVREARQPFTAVAAEVAVPIQ